MSRARLSAAANHFFARIFPAVSKTPLKDLVNAEVMVGAYRRNTGGAVKSFGRELKPDFMLKFNAAPVPLQDGLPALGDREIGDGARDQSLVWLRFAADAKVDDEATIKDLMGDLDTYAQKKFSLAGIDVELPDDVPTPPNSDAWAKALVANRTAVPTDLSKQGDEPPPEFKNVAPTTSSLQVILGHFFTYDSTGAYYPRWKNGGRKIPDDLSDVYLRNNVQEYKLARDQMYLYMLAPKSLFTAKNAEAHDYTESVIRFDETGDPTNPFTPTLLHSVYKKIETPVPLHDFIFFESEDGTGLPIPAEVRAKMAPEILQFLQSVPDDPAERAAFVHESPRAIDGNPPVIQVNAILAGPITLPDGASGFGNETGKTMFIYSPFDKVAEIAAMPGVVYLLAAGAPMKPLLNNVRPAIDFDGFRAKFKSKQDGEGAIVGIIDSGIDPNHPAFNDSSGKTRIAAVWDQTDGPIGNANSPLGKHSSNAAYTGLDFGRERTGADVMGTTDDPNEGHGTHVTCIAAGAEVTANGGCPRGIASKATIVLVKHDSSLSSVEPAVKYIFQKATEMNMPCVINMSFGTHNCSHDGNDSASIALSQLLKADAAGNYRKGRILVAAAGNERNGGRFRRFDIHVHRELGTGKSTTVRFTTAANGRSDQDLVTFWIRSDDGNKPNLRVVIRHKTSWTSAAVTPTASVSSVPVPGMSARFRMQYGDKDAASGDFNLVVSFETTSATKHLPTDEWAIIITNSSPTVDIHGWALGHGRFEGLAASDDSYKVGTPACCPDVISVAATCSRLDWPDIDKPTQKNPSLGHTTLGDLAMFSSPGPLRPCSARRLELFFFKVNLDPPAIDIAAPGSATQSALASNVPMTKATAKAFGVTDDIAAAIEKQNRPKMINTISWMMEGTSMAAPVITGLIACVLAENKDLTQPEAVALLNGAGHLPAPAATLFKKGAPELTSWGAGLVNAPALKP